MPGWGEWRGGRCGWWVDGGGSAVVGSRWWVHGDGLAVVGWRWWVGGGGLAVVGCGVCGWGGQRCGWRVGRVDAAHPALVLKGGELAGEVVPVARHEDGLQLQLRPTLE